MDFFRELPIELSFTIFDRFTPVDLAQLLRVNKNWFYLVKSFIIDYKLTKHVMRYDLTMFREHSGIYYPDLKGPTYDIYTYSKSICNVIEQGCSNAVLCELLNKIVYYYVGFGFIRDESISMPFRLMVSTARYGHSENVFTAAAMSGSLVNMKTLLQYKFLWSFDTFIAAIKNGNLGNIKWLHEKGCSWVLPCTGRMRRYGRSNGSKVFKNAIEHGSLENIKWLVTNGCQGDKYTFPDAVEYGNLDIMKWLFDCGYELSSYTFSKAVDHGDLDLMKWLFDRGCKMIDAMRHAVCHGDLDNIKWLFDRGCKLTEWAFSDAIRYGNFDIMKWLFEKGCPYDPNVIENAISVIESGNMDIVKWLSQRGLISSDCLFSASAITRNVETINWLVNTDQFKDIKSIMSIIDIYIDDRAGCVWLTKILFNLLVHKNADGTIVRPLSVNADQCKDIETIMNNVEDGVDSASLMAVLFNLCMHKNVNGTIVRPLTE